MSCNSECKSGCFGSGLYECSECRGFKLVLKDVKRLVDYFLSMSDNDSSSGKDPNALSSKGEDDDFKELKEDFNRYMSKAIIMADVDDSKIFCVHKCPSIMPFKTAEFFCTDDKKLM